MITPVQEAIYSKVSGIAGLGAEVYEQYAPQNVADYPFVVITPIRTVDNSTQGEVSALEATFSIHIFSKSKSSIETATIQKLIYDNLHLATDLSPTGYDVSIIRQESSIIELDQDGITRHGVQNFEIVFEPPVTYSYV